MAAKAIQVELLNQIVRLKSDGFSTSAIARLIGISRPTVIKYLLRLQAQTEGLAALSEEQLSVVYNHDSAPHKGESYNMQIEFFEYAEKVLIKTC